MESPLTSTPLVLVGPPAWRTVWQEAQKGATPDVAAMSLPLALISQYHALHVGLTPHLAQGLAYLLAHGRANDRAWEAVVRRLHETWATLNQRNASSSGLLEAGLALNVSMRYGALRLALPLVARACEKIGITAIWSEESVRGGTDEPATYRDYCERLKTVLEEVAQAKPGEPFALPDAFWQDRAIALAGITVERSVAHANRLPMTSQPDTGAMVRFRELPKKKRDSMPQQIRIARARMTFDRRREEAGAAGIRYSRREEDIPRMLPSEWTYPPLIRLDRLINTGFLVTRRPPVPIQLRDALVVAFSPPELYGTPAAFFLRQVWFDLAARLAVLLIRSGLARSELRWIEAGPRRQFRSLSAVIAQISPRVHLGEHDTETSAAYRVAFARAVRWLPALADRAATMDGLHSASGRDWYRAALEAQLDAPPWADAEQKDRPQRARAANPVTTGRLALNRFTVVHAMHFAPATPGAIDAASDLVYADVDSCSLIMAPPQIQGDGWRFDGHFASDVTLDIAPEQGASDVAAALLVRMLTYLTEVFERG